MRHATIEDAAAVAALTERCRAVDGRSPLSEFKALRVPVANSTRTIVSESDDGQLHVLAVAAFHPTDIGEDPGYWAAEVAVDPSVRSVEVYRSALSELAQDIGRQPSYWAFSAMQEEAALAQELVEVRALVEMRRSLPADTPMFPPGYAVRRFIHGDENLWLALNQQVFAHHPEAGGIDSADLALRMAQPWFDPDGLLFIVHESEGEVGYCWTKVHTATLGEIYMIGLVPEHRGRGLAKPLTRAGLQHLTQRGVDDAMLYAESDNTPAIGLYEGMGFEIVRRLALYAEGPT